MSASTDDRVLAVAADARDWVAARRRSFEQRLAALVSIDSGVDHPQGRDQVAALLAEWAGQSGCDCELVRRKAGGHLIAV